MRTYTREQLLHYLRALAEKLRSTPTTTQMDKHKKYPSSSTYYSRFGSWNAALKEADLPINVRKQYTKKELRENLRQLAKSLGRTPKTTDLKKWTGSYSTYRKYFGSWKKALRAAGLKKGFVNLKKF